MKISKEQRDVTLLGSLMAIMAIGAVTQSIPSLLLGVILGLGAIYLKLVEIGDILEGKHEDLHTTLR